MNVPAGFVRPFHLDDFSMYINDANGNMAADFVDYMCRPRGWGRIQYLQDGETQMNDWEDWVEARVGSCTDKRVIVERFNDETIDR